MSFLLQLTEMKYYILKEDISENITQMYTLFARTWSIFTDPVTYMHTY